MSDEPWPESGAGVTEEPGRAQRSGSRRSDLYTFWLDTMEPVTRGRAVMIFVDKPRFYSNLKTIRKQLGGGDGVDMKPINDRIRAGIKSYAADIKAGLFNVDGKPAWPVFMRVWPKYVNNAARPAATKDEIASGKRRWDE